QIEFTQAAISVAMRSGTSVAGEGDDLILHSPHLLEPENFEKRYKQLNVYKWQDCEYVAPRAAPPGGNPSSSAQEALAPRQVWSTRFMSLDNRRLALLKLCKPGGSVWVNISGDEKDFHFKYDPNGRKKLAHDEIRQVGTGGTTIGGGGTKTVGHEESMPNAGPPRQRKKEKKSDKKKKKKKEKSKSNTGRDGDEDPGGNGYKEKRSRRQKSAAAENLPDFDGQFASVSEKQDHEEHEKNSGT
ncbi:unnamed protein product, partial [Amoebophrya sp. A25]